jgi:hypothetical protein
MVKIGKHLATFNLFREEGGLYVTIADARGVRDELNGSSAPLHLCTMNALREAMRQMEERAQGTLAD